MTRKQALSLVGVSRAGTVEYLSKNSMGGVRNSNATRYWATCVSQMIGEVTATKSKYV